MFFTTSTMHCNDEDEAYHLCITPSGVHLDDYDNDIDVFYHIDNALQ